MIKGLQIQDGEVNENKLKRSRKPFNTGDFQLYKNGRNADTCNTVIVMNLIMQVPLQCKKGKINAKYEIVLHLTV